MKVLFIIVLVLVILIFLKTYKFFKFPKAMSFVCFTGAVKVGKSAVSLQYTIRQYKRIHLLWRIRAKFQKLFKKQVDEEPLFYSNIPLATIKYHELTMDHILGKARQNFKSATYIDEMSLLADSQLIKDKVINNKLLEYCKLYGHRTHGGILVFNTQQITDLHYAIKRCTGQYFYIHSTSKHIPFFTLVRMREERYSEDGTTVNNYNEDIEETMLKIIIPKSIFKKYDYCCYSSLTDSLPTLNIPHFNSKKDRKQLKANKIISFRTEFAELFDRLENYKKEIEKNEKENS